MTQQCSFHDQHKFDPEPDGNFRWQHPNRSVFRRGASVFSIFRIAAVTQLAASIPALTDLYVSDPWLAHHKKSPMVSWGLKACEVLSFDFGLATGSEANPGQCEAKQAQHGWLRNCLGDEDVRLILVSNGHKVSVGSQQ